MCHPASHGLSEEGLAVIDDFIDEPLRAALLEELFALEAGGKFRRGGVSKQGSISDDIRTDLLYWLDEPSPTDARARLWKKLGELRDMLNRELLLGLRDWEAHYTIYPPGAYYGKHLDRFRDDDRRQLSFVLYLNPEWRPEDGGELRVFVGDTPRDISPVGGKLVCFRSERVPHEVRPTRRPRYSLTAWFRDGRC